MTSKGAELTVAFVNLGCQRAKVSKIRINNLEGINNVLDNVKLNGKYLQNRHRIAKVKHIAAVSLLAIMLTIC